jgi:hypothetical protein
LRKTWGNHGLLHNRDRAVLEMIRELGVKPHCLRVTKLGAGSPFAPSGTLTTSPPGSGDWALVFE